MASSKIKGVTKMKITKILPRPFAIGFQEFDLNKSEGYLKYHRIMVQVFEERVRDGKNELHRLKSDSN